MPITPEQVLQAICDTLKLDRAVLISEKKEVISQDYRDAKLIAIHILRKEVSTWNDILWGQRSGKNWNRTGEIRYSIEKKISYKMIGNMFNRKPCSAMASELKCKDLLSVDPAFANKYNMIVDVLNNKNVNVA